MPRRPRWPTARHDHATAATEVERLAQREAELASQLAKAAATRADVEQRLAQVEAARREAERQHASAMTTATTALAERQAQFEVELSQTAAARDDFKRQVNAAETALAEARHDHATAATEVERLTRREAELTAQLAEAAATRRSLEGQLVDATRRPDGRDERADATTPTSAPRETGWRPPSAPPSATRSSRG